MSEYNNKKKNECVRSNNIRAVMIVQNKTAISIAKKIYTIWEH